MRLEAFEAPSVLSRWTSRIALFCLLVIIAAAVLHRLFGMPTPVAFNLVKLALTGALLSLGMGLAAAVGIWQAGRAGASRVVLGVGVSLLMLSLPLMIAVKAREFPDINDLTTDFANVPPFVQLAKLRGPAANSARYPGEAFAKEQTRAYPDLAPLVIDRSVKEAFEIVVDAAKRQKLDIVHEKAPSGELGDAGSIEAVDRTLVLGLYDDIAIRVMGDAAGARVDIRSASRYGRNDLGQNADRMRNLMKEIVVRLEETVPTAENEKKAGDKKALRPGLKRGQGDDPRPVRRRRLRDPALSDTPRAPGLRARPPARAFDQSPDIRPGRSLE